MIYWYRWIIVGTVSLSVIPTWAATVVERRDTRGEKQKIVMTKQQARIETPDPDFYTLIDLEKGKTYMVNAKEKQMVEMDIVGTPPKPPQDMPLPKPREIKTELVKKGNGPKIAGYATVNYQVTVDGKVCSENYFSKEAVEVPYVKAFLDAMYQMSHSRKMKGMPVHPCQQAHDELEAESMKLGVPMKSTIQRSRNKGEKVRYEIIRIQPDVKVPDDIFNLPQGYEVKSEATMMEERRQAMMKRRQEMEQRGDRPPMPPPPREGGQYDERYMPPPPREGGRYDERYMPPPPREGRQYDERYMPPPPRDERW